MDAALHRQFHANPPSPHWWAKIARAAIEVHREIDRQLMLATGDDLVAWKERKSCQYFK